MSREFSIINRGEEGQYRSLVSFETIPGRIFTNEWEQTSLDLHSHWLNTEEDPDGSTTDAIIDSLQNQGWNITVEDFSDVFDK